jgi:hypothetical protein
VTPLNKMGEPMSKPELGNGRLDTLRPGDLNGQTVPPVSNAVREWNEYAEPECCPVRRKGVSPRNARNVRSTQGAGDVK